MNDNVIGVVKNPTSIFIAEKIVPNWINIFGLIIVILIMLPNIMYAVKFHDLENKCKNKTMNLIEQIGRYSSMFLIIFHIGIAEFGFASAEAFVIYLIGNIIFIIVYWIIWGLYFKKIVLWKSMILAIIPTAIFLLSGITSRNYLLVISAILFGTGHLYVTYQNAK
ncbi:MAG TPA: hypothetical protein VJZ04_04550 [Lachnospiraceae bacterium]|nr:hypothetical protein [Lachnospiraceae bacterium]